VLLVLDRGEGIAGGGEHVAGAGFEAAGAVGISDVLPRARCCERGGEALHEVLRRPRGWCWRWRVRACCLGCVGTLPSILGIEPPRPAAHSLFPFDFVLYFRQTH
jgi:hypothetical protein